MDREDIEEMVDDFVEKIKAELVGFSQEMDTSVKGATEEMRAIGLSVEEDAFLMMNMVDPGAILQEGQKRCKAHVEHIYEVIGQLDPEDERDARKMIREALHEFHDAVSDFLFPSS